MANFDPTRLTDAEKTKAAQAKWILLLVVVFFAVLPVIVYWLMNSKPG